MNYKTDQLETAILMEEVSLDRDNFIQREYSYFLPHDMGYLESPLMITESDYKELTSLIDESSHQAFFRGETKLFWTKLLENAEHKRVSL